MPTPLLLNATITTTAPTEAAAVNLVAFVSKNSPTFAVTRSGLTVTITPPVDPWDLPDPPY